MSQSELTRYSDAEVVKELKRELTMRRKVYGQQVRDLKMTQAEMEHRVGIVAQVIADIQAKVAPKLFDGEQATAEGQYKTLEDDSLDAIVEVVGAPAQYNAGKGAMRIWFLNRLRTLWRIETPPASHFDGLAKEAAPPSAEPKGAAILHRTVTVHLTEAPAGAHPVTDLWDQGWRWQQASAVNDGKVVLRQVSRPPGDVPAWVEVSRDVSRPD